MQHVARLSSYWTLLCCLLFQLLNTLLSCGAANKMQTQREPAATLEAKEQQQRPRVTVSAKRQGTDYDKVALLHRLLVQQQLQQLQQRRLLRLALAQRRLDFELSN